MKREVSELKLKIKDELRKIIFRLRGDFTTEQLTAMGMVCGENFVRMKDVILDPSHCWLIEIGDIKLIVHSQVMAHHLLLKTVARVFLAQQCTYLLDFLL